MESIALWKIKDSVKPLQVWSHSPGLSLVWSALLHHVVIPSPAWFSGQSLSFPYRTGVQVAKPMAPFLISFVGKKKNTQKKHIARHGTIIPVWGQHVLMALDIFAPIPAASFPPGCAVLLFLLHFPLATSTHSWRNCLLSTLKCSNKKNLACVVNHWSLFLLTCC